MADKKTILKQAADRTAMIDDIIARLDDKISGAQEKLLRVIVDEFVDQLDIDNGKIVNNLKNKRLLGLIDQAYQKYSTTAGLEVVKAIVEGVQQVTDFNASYFQPFGKPAQMVSIKNNVLGMVKSWLGIDEATGKVTPNGYLDTLIKDSTVKNAIKDIAIRQIVGGNGYQQAKTAIKDFVIGNKEQAGALQKYYRNFVYDAYSQVDRATSQTFADDLGLDYAIYEGGIIKTSRQFCKDHNGKVYTRAEIAEFDPGEKNKQPGYNPFTDLGGYGCRHHLNWIPKALATILRPDLAEKAAAAPAVKAV